jgi:3-deoxy-D-manno-octulosonic-acid transferase
VVGNIKFDLDIPSAVDRDGVEFRALQAADRPVWIAASTHPGEEEKVIVAHSQIRQAIPDALLILVPRHPKRFDAVAQLLQKRGLSYVRRTSGERCDETTEVFLGDTLGELTMFYAASDIAFVGGSLVPIGGHNLLEPAALGIPVITGSNNFNAQDIADLLHEAGVAQIVTSPRQLADEVVACFRDPAGRSQRGMRGREIVAENRGALARLLNLVYPLLDGPLHDNTGNSCDMRASRQATR